MNFGGFLSEKIIKDKGILHNANENKKKKVLTSHKKSLKVRFSSTSLLKLKSLRYPFSSLSIKLIELIDYTIINFEKQIKISRIQKFIYLHFTQNLSSQNVHKKKFIYRGENIYSLPPHNSHG